MFVRMYVCVCVCACGSKRESKRGQRERARDVKEREQKRGSTSLEHVSMDASITKRGKDLSFINFIKGTSEVAKTQKNKNSQNFLPFIRSIEDTCEVVNLSSSSTRFALQCVAVCCSVLQCVAVLSNVLQCGAVCCSVLWFGSVFFCVAV